MTVEFSPKFLLTVSFLAICYTLFAQSGDAPKVRWKFSTNGPVVSSPASDGTNLFIGSYDSTFYALDSRTGTVVWRYRANGYIGSTAALADSKVFFFASDAVLYCLNKTDGKPAWKFKALSGALPDRRYDWPDYYHSSPVIENDLVYFGAGDGKIYCVNATTGKLSWFYQTGDVVHTRPALAGDKLLIGSFDGHMYCLNKSNGSLMWKFKTTGQRYFPRGEVNGSPVIHRGKVFFGARDYNLYALDLEAGYCHWLKTFPQGWALPITPNDSVLYVGTSDDRLLLALDVETGAIQWRQSLGFNIFGEMSLAGNNGYVGTLMGKLFCVDISTGKVEWEFASDAFNTNRSRYFKEDENYFVDDIGTILVNGDAVLDMYSKLGAIFSRPIVVDKRIYFATNDGSIYCLDQ